MPFYFVNSDRHVLIFPVTGAKMMYYLDSSLQDKAFDIATNLSSDLIGLEHEVSSLLI